MQNTKKHINKFLVELEKEQQEILIKKNRYKKTLSSMKQFGGLRLLGYVNEKPLIAQYKIDANKFEIKFNQKIMDKEYAGKFNDSFLNSKLEIYTNGRLSAPLGTIPKRIKGGNTTIGTVAWIATLIEIENMKSDTAYLDSKISKNFFHYVAHAIFTSDALYVEDMKDAISYLDAIRFFQLKDNLPKNNVFLESDLKRNLYPQFLNEIRNKKDVQFTTENRLLKVAA